MTNTLTHQNACETRIAAHAFYVNEQFHDLIFQKSGEIFSVLVKDTRGKICFHEQEIAEQFNVQHPNLDHLIDFISLLYTSGLNLKRNRDYQVKLLVEACPQLFFK